MRGELSSFEDTPIIVYLLLILASPLILFFLLVVVKPIHFIKGWQWLQHKLK
jgi:hypothetical protein